MTVGCVASMEMPKIDRDTSIFTYYDVKSGMRLIDEDLYMENSIDDFKAEFSYELYEPHYDFGDDFEFNEMPSQDSVFSEYIAMELSDFAPAEGTFSDWEGTAFQSIELDVKIIPNFDTVQWLVKLSLVMNGQFFEDGRYLEMQAYFQDKETSLIDETLGYTVSCSIEIGQADVVEILELDTYDEIIEDSAWDRILEVKEYELSEGMNGQKVQSCIAMLEVSPGENPEFFNKDMVVSFWATMYDDVNKSNRIDLVNQNTVEYHTPASY